MNRVIFVSFPLSGKIQEVLFILRGGVKVARCSLEAEIGVRVPAPQQDAAY